MTTFQHYRPLTTPSALEQATPVADTRSRHRAQGWFFVAAGAAVLWTAIIGAAFALFS